MDLKVRDIRSSDIPLITRYWTQSSADYMQLMGVDLCKLPDAEEWDKMLSLQLEKTYNEKQSYCTIWLLNGVPVGHCNANMITFGKQAHMHLHIWSPEHRGKSFARSWLPLSIAKFFKNLKLNELFCEPAAANPGPNKVLPSIGFKFIKNYVTVPGSICHEQNTSQWHLEKDVFFALYPHLH